MGVPPQGAGRVAIRAPPDVDQRQSINGKRDGFVFADLAACAKAASISRGHVGLIFEEVRAAVMRWPAFADAAGVDGRRRDQIGATVRLEPMR